ncbi:MAG: Zn-dependent hydrolase [Bacteroidetes bacterium]|nr:Zn-dependent hydrolase [Bacteroidota bacterium]MCK5766514.1 Zn-dependent hydrolase [Bacteroidales bacterium]
MKTKIFLLIASIVIGVITISCQQEESCKKYNDKQTLIPSKKAFEASSAEYVNERLAIYAPFELTADISHLSEKEVEIVGILFKVARIMDGLFWQQTIGGKADFIPAIADKNTKRFARINYGPWDRLNNNKPFIAGVGEKPRGANFYPADMTKEEFETFDDPNKTSLYTLIRRDENGSLKTVWYHEAYSCELQEASGLLKEAAALAEDPGLKKYLELRAEALVSDNYQPSDFAWMEMQNTNIDFVVGAIENYEDALFGYKAAYESFILLKDVEWSKKLEKFSSMLPDLQKGLPVDDEYKKDVPGSKADMNAYDVIYYAGDCNAGSKTIAINLPNDEEVHVKYGSRKLQLKNAMKAKFDKILLPISELLIDPDQRKYITFTAFFENTMFHEVGHAMGIKNTLNGKGTAREALKEQYSAIEEGKADIMGLYLVTKLYEMGELTEGEVMDNYVTFFAGIFRSSRFGAASSHGKANMMRFNYFKEHEVFTTNEDGTYTVNFEKMQIAMVSLMQKILLIQGNGDYEAAKAWVEEAAMIPPDLQADLSRLNSSNIPVDITFKQGPTSIGLK